MKWRTVFSTLAGAVILACFVLLLHPENAGTRSRRDPHTVRRPERSALPTSPFRPAASLPVEADPSKDTALMEAYGRDPRAKLLEAKIRMIEQGTGEEITLAARRHNRLYQERMRRLTVLRKSSPSEEELVAVLTVSPEERLFSESQFKLEFLRKRAREKTDEERKLLMANIRDPKGHPLPEPDNSPTDAAALKDAAGLVNGDRFEEAGRLYSALALKGPKQQREIAGWNLMLCELAQGDYTNARHSSARMTRGSAVSAAFAFAGEAISAGDWEQAQRWLDRAAETDAPGFTSAAVAPYLEGLARMGWLEEGGATLIPPPGN